MTTPLFLLRCLEIGLSLRDLDLVTIGLVLDMWTEKCNDASDRATTQDGVRMAEQKDFDMF